MRRSIAVLVILVLSLAAPLLAMPPLAVAEAPAGDAFQRTWERTDKPIADGEVSRTWMWGPEAFTGALSEPYAESPDGQRTVQYFDKSRMEITDPDADSSSIWYVTNGLLVVELITGRMQVGNDAFEDRHPAAVNVAGDADDPDGPTYATFADRLEDPPTPVGAVYTNRIDRAGTVTEDPALAEYGVTAGHLDGVTNHTVAGPFWEFMNSDGPVWDGEQIITAPLFENAYFATGRPITEAFWANVRIAGTPQDVLIQCFERRCLTYNPANAREWQVEAGNVGQHYYAWRYEQSTVEVEPGPSQLANALAAGVLSASSDDERYAALLDVMDALHVGVYTGGGEMILGGAERGPADFYLYDIELRMMAAAIGRGQTFGLVDLAMQITALGPDPEGEIVDPELVRQAVLAGIEAATGTPDEFTSLSPLIVRQLGLAQTEPYDLLEGATLSEIRLDPLAYFLLLAEVTVPAVGDELPIETGATSNLVSESNGVLKPVARSLQGTCTPSSQFHGDTVKNVWGWSKISAELFKLIPEVVAGATAVLDALHGAVLAYSVGVRELDDRLETHYGHESEGQAITFRIEVMMRDELPKKVVDCGWIAGTDFPAKGPIPGVSIHWFWGDLEDHGQIDCGATCVVTGDAGLAIDATDASGIARMTFHPKQEANPGEGWVVEEQGVVNGIALYQSKFTNLLGSYAQYLTPKSGMTRWVVERHEPPGYNITMTGSYYLYNSSVGNNGSVTAESEGEFTATAWLPVQQVTPPYPESWVVLATELTTSGSGTGSHTRVVLDANYENTCYGNWSGSWTVATRFFDDGARERNEPVRYIRLPLNPVPWDLQQDDTCAAGFPAAAMRLEWYPWIDLQADGPQERTIDLCRGNESGGGSTCEKTLTLSIEVEYAGPPE